MFSTAGNVSSYLTEIQSFDFTKSFLFKCKTSNAFITQGNELTPLNNATCKDDLTFKQYKIFRAFIL